MARQSLAPVCPSSPTPVSSTNHMYQFLGCLRFLYANTGIYLVNIYIAPAMSQALF